MVLGMVLGIDASRFGLEYPTGVEHYSDHIIRAMLHEIAKDSHSPFKEVVLYARRAVQQRELGCEYPFCRDRVISRKRLWTQIGLSAEMAQNPPNVLFVPSHTLPLIHPKKSVIMIHDVAFRRFKEAYSFFQYAYLQASTWFAVREAVKILTPSEATKTDLMRFFGCDARKIEVVSHGFSAPEDIHLNESEERALLERFGILSEDRYFFFVGRLETKKNLVRLVRAFAMFKEKHPEFKLILAGGRGVGFRALFDEVEYLHLWNSVMMPGYVTDEEKAVLYRHCDGFVFPSLYEGFGLPILQAFYYEKPVLASRCGALKEVCGDAAVGVDSEKEEDILRGLNELMSGPVRKKCVEKGLERLHYFDWRKSAITTLQILSDVRLYGQSTNR